MPIIRRNSCIYATLGTCYSVWMTVWYTVVSPDDGHIVARNVEKINKHTKKNCAPSWLYLQDIFSNFGIDQTFLIVI